jgi:hypothetical protein
MLTVANLQSALAYRLGETSAPSDSTTKAQRLEWMNQGYFKVARQRNWWWLEAVNTSNTNTGSTTGYAEPTDLKAFKELKIDTIFYDEVPYEQNRIYTGASAVVSIPQTIRAFKYYRFGGRYYLVPLDGNDSTAHTIHYYKRVSKNTGDSDTWLIPDEYLDILPAYAEQRYWQSITQIDKASVASQEVDEILAEMVKEQGRRAPLSGILEPEQAWG